MYMYTYMPNYANLGQGQHIFPFLYVQYHRCIYNVNTYPIGFSLPVSSNITTNYIYMFCPHWSAVVITDHHSALPDHHSLTLARMRSESYCS